MREIVWKIGGEQGQGLDSTSDVFATVCSRLGYHVYAYKTFASRIKGGHTNFTVRVSTRRVLAPARHVHVLVVLDQEAVDRTIGDLVPGGLVLTDSSFTPDVPPGTNVISVPMIQIARELGNPVYRNMVAIGASAALLGIPLDGFRAYVADKFGRKGAEVVQGNIEALQRGFDIAREQAGDRVFALDRGDGKPRLLMTGNDATAIGAIAGGCRLVAAYPITPASEILEVAAKYLPKFGGAAVQMEDELSAVAVTIGAGFAGVRAMTSTSGPGISLMQENLGLASMTEIPMVVVDTQRGGPSTGMPTKHEQSDLMALIHGGHGEGPRIVLAPGTAEQIFYDTAMAFNLAENYHCPVIIASDLGLALWQQTVEDIDLDRIEIDRGPLADPAELEKLGREAFQRYAQTETGVSPRSLPGMKNGQYLATGAEHNVFGKVSEDPKNRKQMMDRRLRKIRKLELGGKPVPGLEVSGDDRPDVLLISFGSTIGACWEAADDLREQGLKVKVAQVRVLNPLPVAELQALVDEAGAAFTVENNATAQLAFLLRGNGLNGKPLRSVLKYDGTLMMADEIVAQVREALTVEGVRA
ncbi:2-oxoacid:acceptor oxidoreductase subunit alpha [Caldinitratiruptor microaerophilus]|uniref:Pyruvate ferredoxin oxidoreductase subunit alpha n=1 Tax=Caldinitratiruptor microaerophilus TaxID=671077 RepID=A0AA35CHG9_9FIRM|nr:2-oxoacid:acceptor oxidoreductase subunit alpha [Caldinitratiruptor microaerophilus]BDG59055.1 pyruvate ferredoxin oxidoreductase subunit alpha [Caldinitratiruptor microaerophilus]